MLWTVLTFMCHDFISSWKIRCHCNTRSTESWICHSSMLWAPQIESHLPPMNWGDGVKYRKIPTRGTTTFCNNHNSLCGFVWITWLTTFFKSHKLSWNNQSVKVHHWLTSEALWFVRESLIAPHTRAGFNNLCLCHTRVWPHRHTSTKRWSLDWNDPVEDQTEWSG